MKKTISFTLSIFLLLATILSINLGLYKFEVKQISNADFETKYTQSKTFSNSLDKDFIVSVIGEAKRNVTPDMAKIYASIETSDIDIKISKDLNFDIFDKVIVAITDSGISKDDIVLESFSTYPSYDYTEGKTFTGYCSTTTFSVEIKNIEKTSDVIDSMTENGVTSIRNINYQVSNMDSIYEEVLSDALENAKNKAQKLVQKDDLNLANIKEESTYSITNLYKTFSESLQNNSLIGQIEIHAKVLVNFV